MNNNEPAPCNSTSTCVDKVYKHEMIVDALRGQNSVMENFKALLLKLDNSSAEDSADVLPYPNSLQETLDTLPAIIMNNNEKLANMLSELDDRLF